MAPTRLKMMFPEYMTTAVEGVNNIGLNFLHIWWLHPDITNFWTIVGKNVIGTFQLRITPLSDHKSDFEKKDVLLINHLVASPRMLLAPNWKTGYINHIMSGSQIKLPQFADSSPNNRMH